MTFIFAPRKTLRFISENRMFLRVVLGWEGMDNTMIRANLVGDPFMGISGKNIDGIRIFTEGQPIIIEDGEFFDGLRYLPKFDKDKHGK
jgi:hypothetical protein